MRFSTAGLALLLSLVAACGVPLDSAPQTIDLDLGETPVVETTEAARLIAVPMYLVDDGLLSPVTRDLPTPADIGAILESLLDGTTRPEERNGLRTSIPADTRLLGVETDGSTVRVDLSRDFAAIGGEEELLAVAQVVLTVTEIEDIETVLFELEGVPTDVPLPSGVLSDAPVGADQYRSLLAG